MLLRHGSSWLLNTFALTLSCEQRIARYVNKSQETETFAQARLALLISISIIMTETSAQVCPALDRARQVCKSILLFEITSSIIMSLTIFVITISTIMETFVQVCAALDRAQSQT